MLLRSSVLHHIEISKYEEDAGAAAVHVQNGAFGVIQCFVFTAVRIDDVIFWCIALFNSMCI